MSIVAGVDFGTLSVRVSLFDKHSIARPATITSQRKVTPRRPTR
jgi:ribulose kinase